MRSSRFAVVLVSVGLTACTPDIVPGAFLCGPEQACPDGLACDGVDAVCVLPSAALPFGCGDDLGEQEPNDDLATAQAIGALACVSPPTELLACAPAGDVGDVYAVAVPAACVAVAVVARISFPSAFERLGIELLADDGAVVATSSACPNQPAHDGDEEQCLTSTVTPGGSYGLRVARTGEGDCGGACANNRYALSIRLATP